MQDMPITRSPVSRLISTFAGSQDNWSTFAKVSERKFENHACPLFLFEVTKQKCSRYSHRVGLIRPRDADKEWHDTYCIFRKQNVFFNPSLLIMDRWDDSWESTNFHNFWQNLLDATQLSARCFIAKVRLSWNNLCNTAWRSSRESHESRLISLLDRRPSPTSKKLQLDAPPNCDLGQVKEMSCRVAHYFQQQGYKKGDVSRDNSLTSFRDVFSVLMFRWSPLWWRTE